MLKSEKNWISILVISINTYGNWEIHFVIRKSAMNVLLEIIVGKEMNSNGKPKKNTPISWCIKIKRQR